MELATFVVVRDILHGFGGGRLFFCW